MSLDIGELEKFNVVIEELSAEEQAKLERVTWALRGKNIKQGGLTIKELKEQELRRKKKEAEDAKMK